MRCRFIHCNSEAYRGAQRILECTVSITIASSNDSTDKDVQTSTKLDKRVRRLYTYLPLNFSALGWFFSVFFLQFLSSDCQSVERVDSRVHLDSVTGFPHRRCIVLGLSVCHTHTYKYSISVSDTVYVPLGILAAATPLDTKLSSSLPLATCTLLLRSAGALLRSI